MRRFSSNDDFSDLEGELRGGRAEPRAELLHELVARVDRPPVRPRRPSFALALAFALVVLGAFASFGGVGYAKSSVQHAAKSVGQVASAVVRTERHTANGPGTGNNNTGNGTGSNNNVADNRHGHPVPPFVHQYHRFVLVCHNGHTIVVPQQSVGSFVPPGTLGPCRHRGG